MDRCLSTLGAGPVKSVRPGGIAPVASDYRQQSNRLLALELTGAQPTGRERASVCHRPFGARYPGKQASSESPLVARVADQSRSLPRLRVLQLHPLSSGLTASL